MRSWSWIAAKGLATALLVLPALLAFFAPDGGIWGGGKGGKP
ncbi:MAG TPA: hypothetical protein VJ300_01875 [Thermoplasmata archaeon]|nr:hypothetical protein [Thermoplasmata archaeon]